MSDVVLEIPFFGGIDEATRDEYVDPTAAFRALVNVRADGRGGVCKRLGYAAVERTRLDGTERTSGHRLFSYGDQVCIIDAGGRLDVRAPTAVASITKGVLPEATYRFVAAPTLGVRADVADVIAVNGYVVISWVVRTGQSGTTRHHYAAVLDARDGAIVRGPEILDSAVDMYTARLASYGDRVVAFTCDRVTGQIRVRVISLEDRDAIHAGWDNVMTVVEDYDRAFAAANVSLGDRVAFAYGNDGSEDDTAFVTVATLNAGGILEQVRLSAPGVSPGPGEPLESPVALEGVDISEGGSILWVAYNSGDAILEGKEIKVVGLDPANITAAPIAVLSTLMDTTPRPPRRVIVAPMEDGTTGKAALFVTVDDGLRSQAIKADGGATVVNGSAVTLGGVELVGRPLLRDGRVFAPFASSNLGELVLCECTPDTTGAGGLTSYLRPVVAPIVRGLYSAEGAMRCRTAAVDASRYFFGFLQRKSGATAGTALLRYDFDDPHRWQVTALNGTPFISGGVESVFDGHQVFESGFFTRPSTPVATVSDGGAHIFEKGGRKYVAVYEHIDARGNRHISGVSDPSGATGNGVNKRVVLSTRPLAITSRRSVQVAFFATLDGGEPPYYRVTSGAGAETGVANDPNATTVTFEDPLNDLALAEQELLMGTGSLPGTGAGQDHRAPPGFAVHTTYNGMVCGASGNTVWCTASALDGEGAWWSPIFTAQVPETVTALASQDTVLYAFAAESIYAINGDPPSDNGQVGGLSTPYRLAGDVGCTNPSSVVVTSLGIFFQSARGIDLLARGGSVTWIGEKVDRTFAMYPHVTSAVLDDKNGIVRFSVVSESGEGRDLVFDLTAQQWVSVDDKAGSSEHEASQDAAMLVVSGARRYAWLASDGNIYVEQLATDESAHLDVGAWVTMRAETSWIHIAGLGGEQVIERILHLSSKHTDHGVVRSVYRDYLATDPQVTTWTWEQIEALPKQWLDKELAASRGQAIRVVLEDAPPSSEDPEGSFDVASGKGATWVGLTFTGTPHRGPRRTSAAERG